MAVIEELLEPLRRSRSAVLHPPAPADRVAALDLPEDHRAFLRATNGIEVYGGYVRLYGIDREESADLARWNDPETWKFAWPPELRGYRCIGQTAWGDQFAYAPGGDGSIVLIDADDGEVEPWSDDFAEFLEVDVAAVDEDPRDEGVIAARARLGDLPTGVLLAYVPSPLLGGPKEVERLIKMEARAALITKGDILAQARAAPRGAAVRGVQPYIDEQGRQRLRLLLG